MAILSPSSIAAETFSRSALASKASCTTRRATCRAGNALLRISSLAAEFHDSRRQCSLYSESTSRILTFNLDSGVSLPRGTVHIYRTKFLTELVCYDQIALNNYSDNAIDVDFSFDFEADFADIFEVRGEKRKRRGEKLPEELAGLL